MIEEKEIRDAVLSMNPNKSLGMDGMGPLFFQKFWHIIKDDIVRVIQTFFHTGLMLKSVNHTIITLIPKTENPTNLRHYRPINLCQVLYKIIYISLQID